MNSVTRFSARGQQHHARDRRRAAARSTRRRPPPRCASARSDSSDRRQAGDVEEHATPSASVSIVSAPSTIGAAVARLPDARSSARSRRPARPAASAGTSTRCTTRPRKRPTISTTSAPPSDARSSGDSALVVDLRAPATSRRVSAGSSARRQRSAVGPRRRASRHGVDRPLRVGSGALEDHLRVERRARRRSPTSGRDRRERRRSADLARLDPSGRRGCASLRWKTRIM